MGEATASDNKVGGTCKHPRGWLVVVEPQAQISSKGCRAFVPYSLNQGETMITNDRERKICKKYSARDEGGHVHCYECPLNKGNPRAWDFRCKANSHYDRHTKEWEYDERREVEL